MLSGLFNLTSLNRSISYIGVSGQSLLLSCFVGISELDAKSADPDQMPLSVASYLCLHCLPMSHFWDARYKLVK